MTPSNDLFRREALEFRTRRARPGGALQLGAPWVRWAYWLVLALVAAGLGLAAVARVDQTISGPALVDPQGRTFVAALPAAARTDLEDGRPLHLEVGGAPQRVLPVRVVDVAEAAEADARRAGLTWSPDPAVLVTGVLGPDAPPLAGAPPRLTGRAVVDLGSQRALSVFLHGFDGASDGGDG